MIEALDDQYIDRLHTILMTIYHMHYLLFSYWDVVISSLES